MKPGLVLDDKSRKVLGPWVIILGDACAVALPVSVRGDGLFVVRLADELGDGVVVEFPADVLGNGLFV